MGKMKKPTTKTITHGKRQKNPKNRKTKTEIVFDEAAREEYLTGFRKRKKERKEKALEAQIAQLKEEKRQIKADRRAARLKELRDMRGDDVLDELDQIADRKTIELENHTVTISNIASCDFVGHSGAMLGSNMAESGDDEAGNDEAPLTTDTEKKSKDLEEIFRKKVQKKQWKPEWKRHKNLTHLAHKKKSEQIGGRMHKRKRPRKTAKCNK